MKRLTLLLLLFGLTTPAAAQISLVDNPDNPWSGRQTSGTLTFSQAATVSSGADMFVLDVSTYGNASFATSAGFHLTLNGTPLIEATGIIPTGSVKEDSSIWYLANPPTGSLTLAGTFGTANAAMANYYTLGNVNTAVPIVAGSVNAGSATSGNVTFSAGRPRAPSPPSTWLVTRGHRREATPAQPATRSSSPTPPFITSSPRTGTSRAWPPAARRSRPAWT